MDLSKTQFVYHGSPKRNIKTLKPESHRILNGEKVVFAGELWMAILCTKYWLDKDIKVGEFNGKPYIRELSENALKRIYYGGGWVYALDSKYFHNDSRLTTFECISFSEVPILNSIYVSNVIERLISLGVKIDYYKPKLLAIDWVT